MRPHRPGVREAKQRSYGESTARVAVALRQNADKEGGAPETPRRTPSFRNHEVAALKCSAERRAKVQCIVNGFSP
jgi:hypothetical protein